jgi:hypothetical protein
VHHSITVAGFSRSFHWIPIRIFSKISHVVNFLQPRSMGRLKIFKRDQQGRLKIFTRENDRGRKIPGAIF